MMLTAILIGNYKQINKQRRMQERNENVQKQPMLNKRISIQTTINCDNKVTRHTSVMYGAEFFSTDPIFRRNRNSEVAISAKIQKNQIFNLVYRFLGHLITDSSFLASILADLRYDRDSTNISVNKISKSCFSVSSQSSEPQISASSLKKQESQEKLPQLLEVKRSERKQKLSILVEGSLSQMGSNSWFSSQSLLNIGSLKFPTLLLSEELIEKIFEEPEPFLVNLSLCLMAKFLFYSKTKLNGGNIPWILSISTIIAYKIYYDQPVQGLVDSFSEILEIENADIKMLQRYFLEQIEFQAVITNEQYHTMLSRVLQA